jgi:hypothetical protein
MTKEEGSQANHDTEEAKDNRRMAVKCPEKIPFYRDSWSMRDLYDKPLDWREQENEYNKKVVKY